MDYDDGYIAYLNGRKFSARPTSWGPLEMRDFTDGYLEAVLFNGGIPDMVTRAADGPGSHNS